MLSDKDTRISRRLGRANIIELGPLNVENIIIYRLAGIMNEMEEKRKSSIIPFFQKHPLEKYIKNFNLKEYQKI